MIYVEGLSPNTSTSLLTGEFKKKWKNEIHHKLNKKKALK